MLHVLVFMILESVRMMSPSCCKQFSITSLRDHLYLAGPLPPLSLSEIKMIYTGKGNKENWLPWNVGDLGTPESGKIHVGGNGYPIQHSYLKNPLDREALLATVHGDHKKSDMPEQLTHNEL